MELLDDKFWCFNLWEQATRCSTLSSFLWILFDEFSNSRGPIVGHVWIENDPEERRLKLPAAKIAKRATDYRGGRNGNGYKTVGGYLLGYPRGVQWDRSPGNMDRPGERPGKMIRVVKSNIETADNFPLGPLGIRDQAVN
ncbi:hypothetical protein WN51_08315 [Melipona quadrifasciata]|uniref:Uncharacterized protein n=1 Tax=Melipona quadrifasciata TaxID=166423 RepID=A0A0M9AC59_9HYME|nr:hypothetical protein WN51_08315 [Melipona quadrifasciata]